MGDLNPLLTGLDNVRVVGASSAQDAGAPAPGDIWWTASSFDGPGGYECLDRMPFVILGQTEEADQEWFDAAPVWHDIDLANELDLILEPQQSSIDLPLRVQLRREITLAFEQFHDKLGEVKAEGMELIEAARSGQPSLEHFGAPYESGGDWRLDADRWAADLIGRLQAPYFATLAQAEAAIDAAPGDVAGEMAPLFILFEARLKEVAVADHEFALAADSSPKQRIVDLHSSESEISAHLWANALQDVLELHIQKIAVGWLGQLELMVGLKNGRTVSSGMFSPKPGTKIAFAKGEAITPNSIDLAAIRARVRQG
jgi:hypothetical protein